MEYSIQSTNGQKSAHIPPPKKSLYRTPYQRKGCNCPTRGKLAHIPATEESYHSSNQQKKVGTSSNTREKLAPEMCWLSKTKPLLSMSSKIQQLPSITSHPAIPSQPISPNSLLATNHKWSISSLFKLIISLISVLNQTFTWHNSIMYIEPQRPSITCRLIPIF